MPSILLLDDQPGDLQATQKCLECQGFEVTAADSLEKARAHLSRSQYDAVVAEYLVREEEVSSLIEEANPTPVLFLSNYTGLRAAVDAVRKGAQNYLIKPCAPADLGAAVTLALRPNQPQQSTSDVFEGQCPPLKRLHSQLQQMADIDSTVLILGETGTGKELTAQRLHQASRRREQALVAVNCAAIPETLIESELFGYEKGAFTGANTNRIGLIEAADGGTLFLDEIGELPLSAQARLLRFIQEGEIRRIGSVTPRKVDVRLICATHRELAELADRAEFRQDLYYRINVLRLEMPPLRNRGDDIIAMALWFAQKLAAKLGRPEKALSDAAKAAIHSHHWPGNVRELQHAIERGLVMATGDVIEAEDLDLPRVTERLRPVSARPKTHAATKFVDSSGSSDEELSLEDYFMRFVLEHQDSMSETQLAQKLGVSRKCLWERRQRFGLPRIKSPRKKQA